MNSETQFHVSVMDARLKKVKKQRNKFKDERDSLIKDIAELRQYKRMYQALVEHIKVKAEANPSEWRYISLVHFVDNLKEEE
ncbi:hypothetical protein [Staphylococcus pettenkoferi]|uniref:Uncharacterized protein n=1 Tax=Staphylococcus pettenkoferi TaxID=170573 RepID=A0A9Q4D5I8_9STAP|nr:hypothetical protein [Staphylococcus pettenkoferi]MCY1595441.1 hypothetical protein [Staphylococcus pettenkoferi]